MDAIFFRLRTGCQWKALDPTRFCPGSTAHDRFQQWVRDGVFLEMWRLGPLEYDGLRGIDWSWLAMDGCMTKAPLGGEKDREKPDRPGPARRQAQPARRWVVERTHSWLNRFRGILIRWEKKPENYFALCHFAFALIAYPCSGLFG
jgi:transposase